MTAGCLPPGVTADERFIARHYSQTFYYYVRMLASLIVEQYEVCDEEAEVTANHFLYDALCGDAYAVLCETVPAPVPRSILCGA